MFVSRYQFLTVLLAGSVFVSGGLFSQGSLAAETTPASSPQVIQAENSPAKTVSASTETVIKTSAPLTPIHITLLHVNDVYQLCPSGNPKLGGLARLATLVKAAKKENPNTLFVFSGDTISPSLASHVFRGKQMIDLWNQLGVSVAVLGNHEFDYGNDVLKQRLSESKFPWIAANVLDKKTGAPIEGISAYVIKNLAGIKLGFFGLLTVDTQDSSHPGSNVRFADPVETTDKALPEIKKAGADLVIGLTHLDMSEDQRVARLHPMQIALILGGHEHTLLQSVAGGTPILKMDSDAAKMSHVDLYIDPQAHTLEHIDWKVIPVDSTVAEDPDIAANVAHYEDQLTRSMGDVVGATAVPLDAAQHKLRTQETVLGDFLADSFRKIGKTDIALLNSGGIRSNTQYPAGQLTLKDVISWLPFENRVVRSSLTGRAIKAALENGVSGIQDANEPGSFPVVSGVKFTYDARLPIGQRIIQVSINDSPLKADKIYSLTTTDYLIQGKDGYVMLKRPFQVVPGTDSELIARLIKQEKTITPVLDGRIKRLTE
jgi:5'-nucleotidase